MDTDNVLTFEQSNVENEMRNNYIINYANLIADNVASYYKYYGNNSNMPLRNIIRMSKDDYILVDEHKRLNHLIAKALKIRHNLKLVSGYEDNELILEELK